MKTKLLIACIGLLFTSYPGYCQNQRTWAMATNGGAFNGGTIISCDYSGNFQLEHSFQPPDGYRPMGSLLQASDGNLYGTCYEGGSFASCTVFRFDPVNKTYLDVYDFDIIHGDFPRSGVIEVNGKLYGAASSGGASGGGVIYSYDLTAGVYTDLVDLSATANNGVYPEGRLMHHSNGKLYGMTLYGGVNNTGVIYSFDIGTSTYTTEFTFTNLTGTNPYGHLIEVNGLLYGMTSAGGLNNKGVIFQFDPSNSNYTVLHDFNGSDGESPDGSLMKSSNGLLYGMTTLGGANSKGVIFSFDLFSGNFIKLNDFDGINGSKPLSDLFEDNNGWLMGTASEGGVNNNGTAFSFDLSNNTFTNLLNFDGTYFGSAPNGGFMTYTTATGVQDETDENQLTFYPNPVKDIITLNLPASNGMIAVRLTDVTGRLVTSLDCVDGKSLHPKMNVSKLHSGIYLLESEMNGKRVVQKVIKE